MAVRVSEDNAEIWRCFAEVFHEPTAISQRLGGIYYAAWSEIITGVIKLKPGMKRNYQKLERSAPGHAEKAKLFPQKLLSGHCYTLTKTMSCYFLCCAGVFFKRPTQFCNLLINFNAFDSVITCRAEFFCVQIYLVVLSIK